MRYLLVPGILCAALLAQAPKAEEPLQRIITTVTEIEVPVTVHDRDGNTVNGVQPRNFRLLDNGREQDIKVTATYHPISLVICVQSNAAVEAVLPQIRKIGSLLESVIVGDQGEAAVLAFDHRLQTLTPFTNDAAKVTEALQKLKTGSSSARQIDAVQQAVRMLRSRPTERRRVILSIAETRDVASEGRLRETLVEAQLANVTVYALNVSRIVTTLTGRQQPPRPDPLPPAARGVPSQVPATPEAVWQKSGGQGNSANFIPLLVEIFRDVKAIFIDNHAEAFTKATGGQEFSFKTQRGLEEAIAKIGEDIHSQYMITYSPSKEVLLEGGFHEIQVVVNHPEVKRVRTRPGYWLAARNDR